MKWLVNIHRRMKWERRSQSLKIPSTNDNSIKRVGHCISSVQPARSWRITSTTRENKFTHARIDFEDEFSIHFHFYLGILLHFIGEKSAKWKFCFCMDLKQEIARPLLICYSKTRKRNFLPLWLKCMISIRCPNFPQKIYLYRLVNNNPVLGVDDFYSCRLIAHLNILPFISFHFLFRIPHIDISHHK